MNYANKLNQASLGLILEDYEIKNPIVQLIAYKSSDIEGSKRYSVVLSDGIYSWRFCLITDDQACRIDNLELDRFCLIKLKKYSVNKIGDKKVIILIESQVVVKGNEINFKLMDPVQYDDSSAPLLSNFIPNYNIQLINDDDYDDDYDLNNNTSNIHEEAMTSSMLKQLNIVSPTKKMKNSTGSAISLKNSYESQNYLNPSFIIDLISLNPFSFRWVVKGRVTSKATLKYYDNEKGSGSYFSFNFKDKTCEVRITAFNEAAEKFFELIKTNNCYLIGSARVRKANQEYIQTSHPYEIFLDPCSIVQICEEEINDTEIVYNFVNFEELKNYQEGKMIDTMGIIKEIGETSTYMKRRSGIEGSKICLYLVDNTKNEILVTLWDEQTTSFNGKINDVCILRNVIVSDYKNLSLNSSPYTVIELNKKMVEVDELKEWWTFFVNDSIKIKKLTKRPSFLSDDPKLNLIKLDEIKKHDYGISMRINAVILEIGRITLYKGCSICNKKLLELSDGYYRCEKCSIEKNAFDWKLVISLCITDQTDCQWVQVFNKECKKLLNCDSFNELNDLFEEDRSKFDEIIQSVIFKKFEFKLNSKIEIFNQKELIKTDVVEIKKINHLKYAKSLIDEIYK